MYASDVVPLDYFGSVYYKCRIVSLIEQGFAQGIAYKRISNQAWIDPFLSYLLTKSIAGEDNSPLRSHCRRFRQRRSMRSTWTTYSWSSLGSSCRCLIVPLMLTLGKIVQYLKQSMCNSAMNFPCIQINHCSHTLPG